MVLDSLGGPRHCPGMASAAQADLQQCWENGGLWGGWGAGPLENGWGSAWCSDGCFWLNDRFEPELVKAWAARDISDLTDPGLCYRSDYPRRGKAGKAWSGSQKQLSKYRFASFLFPQFGLPDTQQA